MTARVEEAVFVEAPARLHFGVLDLRGAMGRWFGGIGAAAPAPTLLVSASHADGLIVEGEEGERATEFTCLNRHSRPGNYKYGINVNEDGKPLKPLDPFVWNE